jgi:multiple sugar transport system ATP-binding protein
VAEITLEGISKRFPDGTEAVAPLDLTIRDGELFVLVGPSGCGKSTLLNMIVGLEQPSTGDIRVGGQTVTRLDPKDRNMAMVFQSYALYPHMTVRDNMSFPLRLAKLAPQEIEVRVRRAAEILELSDLLDRKPAALSGGQRQRVAMGRAIVREPAAFLLDEPLSNLDAKLRAQMRTELARLQKRLGTTTLYVTHDQTEAMTLGDRIAVLRGGRLQQVGTPRALYEEPANLFVAGFVGSPAMNFLPARVKDNRLILPMVELPLPERFRAGLPAGGPHWIVGVRPEHFQDAILPGRAEGAAPGFTATVELAEWLGADIYVYFQVASEGAEPPVPPSEEQGSVPGPSDGLQIVARLTAASQVVEGAPVSLRINTDEMVLFDLETGRRVTARGESGHRDPVRSSRPL